MNRVEVRSIFVLGLLAGVGLVINLGILTTATAHKEEVLGPIDTSNPRNQQIILSNLRQQLEEARATQFPTLDQARENLRNLFDLAEEHGVSAPTLNNSDPQPEKLGRLNFEKLVTRVEIHGRRSSIIGMLLDTRKIFGEASFLSNVSVNGTEEAWTINLNLTQYLRTS